MSRLVVYSNRLPLGTSPSGGLVVALGKAMDRRGGVWIGAKLDEDETTGQTLKSYEGASFDRYALHLPAEEYNNYYLGYANSVLWPLFHGRADLLDVADGQLAAYTSVNRKMAEASVDLLEDDDVIWIHDYHFIPLAAELRKLGVTNPIGFFLHTPFPSSSNLHALSHKEMLLDWLAAYDLVGLQTQRDVSAMLEVCRTIFGGQVLSDGRIRSQGQDIWAASFPIGIDVEKFRQTAESQEVTSPQIDPRQKLLIGVDRLDYSKGLPHKFRGFQRFLEDQADDSDRLTLLQIASPTREDVEAYQEIRHELEQITGEVNGEFAELGYIPIQYIHRAVPRDYLAGLYRQAAIGLVTPLIDGMNLVAKEYVAAQDPEDPGVLILSESAGAAEQLKCGALIINPYDPTSIAEAIRTAVSMSLEERIERHQAMWTEILKRNVYWWTETFLDRLNRNAASRLSRDRSLADLETALRR
ncbi:alpha,alpha-trehalose-phosphate synthase (UDP-forming) [Hyphomonas sp.]|uniref:alpha,alpha-trehalose-phosphate synthase (UDP-forming) n=1 Tax=Hyphomonas sp. TaxID=87 RepID=UPI0030035DA8